jgi:hypothetical protein
LIIGKSLAIICSRLGIDRTGVAAPDRNDVTVYTGAINDANCCIVGANVAKSKYPLSDYNKGSTLMGKDKISITVEILLLLFLTPFLRRNVMTVHESKKQWVISRACHQIVECEELDYLYAG